MNILERLQRYAGRARHASPRGRSLSGEAWEQRHRGILILLWAHVVGLTAFGIFTGAGLGHSATEGGVVAVSVVLATTAAYTISRAMSSGTGMAHVLVEYLSTPIHAVARSSASS